MKKKGRASKTFEVKAGVKLEVAHRRVKDLPNGRQVELVRFTDGHWGMRFKSLSGAAVVRTTFGLSDEAMKVLVDFYNEMRDMPIAMTMNVWSVVKKLKKKKRKP